MPRVLTWHGKRILNDDLIVAHPAFAIRVPFQGHVPLYTARNSFFEDLRVVIWRALSSRLFGVDDGVLDPTEVKHLQDVLFTPKNLILQLVFF